MTVRTRKGGVYDWSVPGPNAGTDSTVQRRTKPVGRAITAAPSWDSRGRRKVRMAVGGRAVGEFRRNGTWRLYGANFPDGKDVTGTWVKFGTGLQAMRNAL